MNWTGGRRTRIQASEEKVRQRQFFDRQRRQTPDRQRSLAFEGSRRVGHSSDVYKSFPQPQRRSKQPEGTSQSSTELDLKASHHDRWKYNSARLVCLDMLKSSSFDWVGEAFLLRSLPDQGKTTPSAMATKRSWKMDQECENEYLELSKRNRMPGASEKQISTQQIYFNDDDDYSDDLDDHEKRGLQEEEEEPKEEEEEEEFLVIPERHLANCREYRSRQREEERMRNQTQRLVKVKSDDSDQADGLNRPQCCHDTEDERRQAQNGSQTKSAIRIHGLRVPSSQLTDDGPTSFRAASRTQMHESFGKEPVSLTASTIDILPVTNVDAEFENEATTTVLSPEVGPPEVSPLPPLYSDSSDARHVRSLQETDIPLVEDLAPTSEAITDGHALSFMSSVISASPDWPPPNQLAGHQLQLKDITEVHHDDFFNYNTHSEEKIFSVDRYPSLHTGFCTDVAAESYISHLLVKEQPASPPLVLSDPEDTSVLEPICSLDGLGLLYESPVETHGYLNPSPSEWIGSDDWVEE